MVVPLTVEDVMSSPVETIPASRSAAEAARRLEAANVGSLVVCDDGGPTGIVTESDMVGLIARNADTRELSVGKLMSGELVTATPETTLEAAAETMADNGIRRLPVEAGDGVAGVVTTTDLSDYLPRLAGREASGQRTDERQPGTAATAYDQPGWRFERDDDDEVAVGDTVRFEKTVSESDVEQFAELSGDTNRIHLESDFAEATMFGGRIAHGILTAGLISSALARLPGLTIYLSQDLRFLGPVEPGETVTAVCEVIEDLDKGKYELATTVYGADGEVVIDGDAVVLIDELPDAESD
jgi:acyl dehydratase/CBS domain-containing protein